MTLSIYHQKYANLANKEIKKRANVKEQELIAIFRKIKLNTDSNPVKVAVLGCGDKRFIAHHERIFKKILNRNIEIITFDITIRHLDKEPNVFQHDCTQPLPNPPYDIIYGHILLKFIKTEKQFELIKNSFDAFKKGGIAIHIFDWNEIKSTGPKLSDGLWTVPLDQWKQKLTELNIKFKEIPLKHGLALIILR